MFNTKSTPIPNNLRSHHLTTQVNQVNVVGISYLIAIIPFNYAPIILNNTTSNKCYLILSYLILYYLILSYLILSYLILSYLILSYLILSYLILSYLILSYLLVLLFKFSFLSNIVLFNFMWVYIKYKALGFTEHATDFERLNDNTLRVSGSWCFMLDHMI